MLSRGLYLTEHMVSVAQEEVLDLMLDDRLWCDAGNDFGKVCIHRSYDSM